MESGKVKRAFRRCGNCDSYRRSDHALYCGNEHGGSPGEILSPFDGEGCGDWSRVTDVNIYELRWRMFAIVESAELNGLGPEETRGGLEGLGGGLEEVCDGLAAANAGDRGNMAAIKAEKARLSEREDAAEKRIGLRKESIRQMMEAAGIKSLKTALYTYSIRKNQPGVKFDDEGEIPDCYMKAQAPVPDKLAIAYALKEGRDVPGARLERTESLVIT